MKINVETIKVDRGTLEFIESVGDEVQKIGHERMRGPDGEISTKTIISLALSSGMSYAVDTIVNAEAGIVNDKDPREAARRVMNLVNGAVAIAQLFDSLMKGMVAKEDGGSDGE